MAERFDDYTMMYEHKNLRLEYEAAIEEIKDKIKEFVSKADLIL